MSLKKIRVFFKHMIFGTHPITDYLAIGMPPEQDVTAQWQIGDHDMVVSTAFIMYDPPLVALDLEDYVLPKEDRQVDSKLTFKDLDKNEVLGSMKLPALAEIELNEGAILIYQIADSELVLKSLQERLVNGLLYRRLEKNHRSFLSDFSPRIYRIISNFFLHPRQVRLLTMHSQDDSLLHFPLDLFMRTSEHAFFGLRNTNKAVAQLTEGTLLCLSDVVAAYRGIIYKLGKFGGADEEAPEMIESEKLDLPLPAVFNHYVELEIVRVFSFEHQCLFQARVINDYRAREEKPVLAHIQRLRYSRCPPSYHHELL